MCRVKIFISLRKEKMHNQFETFWTRSSKESNNICLFANHLEALPFLLVINNSKQKKGKKMTFYGKNWWKQDSWFGGLMLRTRYISAIRTFWKMSIWWHFYITTINSPLISERQTRKSLSATSLHDRNLVPTMELKNFKGRL